MKSKHAWHCRTFAKLVFLAVFFVAIPYRIHASDSLGELSQHIADRQIQIQKAVSDGAAVETPQGLLEPLGGASQETQDLIRAENKDRRAVFAKLAAKYKVTSSKIAGQFAQMAAGHSKPPAGPPTSTAPSPSASPAIAPTPGEVSPSATAPPGEANPSPVSSPVHLQGKTPSKIITKPKSSILADASESAAVVQSAVPAFTVYYVYSEQPGWLQIGKTKDGGSFGWIREKDAIPWDRNLVMEFRSPVNRMPVMFFREKDDLKRIVQKSSGARISDAENLLSTIKSGNIPAAFPVEAIEPPNRATDSRTKWYMLPIMDYEDILIDGREGKLLKVAGVTRDRKNQSLDSAFRPLGTSSAAGSALLDVVFVMDCTSSMQPMVNATMQAIRGLVSKLASDPDTSSAMNLGFWGYRDSSPDQDFSGSPVKNFTPSLQPAQQFLKTLSRVEVSSNPAGDYPEDVLGGLKAAINETHWRPNSIRVVILVGDASAHPAGHSKNSSGLGESQLRARADMQNIYLASFYIERESPLAAQDRHMAEGQFRTLAKNRTAVEGKEDFTLIKESGGLANFSGILGKLADDLSSKIRAVRDKTFSPSDPTALSPGGETPEETGSRLANNMFSGAFIDWLARQKDTAVAPPGDIESWVVDRDLKDPVKQPMEVKVLLHKNELDDLAKVLDSIIIAGVKKDISGQNFFEALQSATASAVASPDQIRNAQSLKATGLLPRFLDDLPYKSRLMKMDSTEWNSMSADTVSQILEQVEAKRNFYVDTLKDDSMWSAFNPEDSDDEKVAAIPLTMFP